MKSILNAIESCDSFGVLLQLRLKNNEPKFRSLYGGVLTLAIYSIACVYFIYLMLIWQTKQIPPTVTTQTRKQEEGQYLHVNNPIFYMNVNVDNPTEETRDIESKTHLYDVSGLYYGKNYMIKKMQPNEPGDTCGMKKIEIDLFDPICQNLKDDKQTWLYQSAAKADDVFWEYHVNFCDPSKDPTCTNETQRKQILDAVPFWQLVTITQDIDLATGQIYQIPSDYYFDMDPKFKQSFTIQLKVTKAELRIDDGFLFPNYRYQDLVKDVKIIFDQNQEQTDTGPVVVVSLEKYYYKIDIQYAKFGDVLASFSSLLQGLLLCGIIMTSFNNNSLIKQSEDQLMSMYFPQLRNYKQITNWRGQVKSVLNNGVEIDSQSKHIFLKTMERLRSKMSLKFNHLNLLHEINKLQLTLYSMRSKEHIQKIQQQNYHLKFPVNLNYQLDSPTEDHLDYGPLGEQDFLIFLSSIDIDSPGTEVLNQNFICTKTAIKEMQVAEYEGSLMFKNFNSERGSSRGIQHEVKQTSIVPMN